jgi:hypothetical protein
LPRAGGDSCRCERGRGKADHESCERDGGGEENPEVNRDDESVAWTGDKARHASIQSDRRSRAEEERGESADANRGEKGNDPWPWPDQARIG